MAIYEVDDLDSYEQRALDHGVRIAWRGDFATIRGRHLHPADVGGAIVSIDQPIPSGSWAWAGPTWSAHNNTTVVTAIAGVTVGATDPGRMQARWNALGVAHSIRFTDASARGDGIDALELVATRRDRVGEELVLGGVVTRLV